MHSFDAKILAKKRLTPDCLELVFSKPIDFFFKPGQFVILQVSDGVKSLPRSYSILSGEGENDLRLCVKLLEGGFASEVFEQVKVGDRFLVKGPFGHFVLDEDGKDNWFMATGTGVVPFYSILRSHLANSKARFTLLFGARTEQDLLYHNEFLELAKDDRFNYLPSLTKENWKGLKGRIQKHLPDKLQDKVFYLCGWKEFVLETKDLLEQRGVPKNNVKFERYS